VTETLPELAGLLATGERAAFHGRPDDAVDPLTRAAASASAAGQAAEAHAAGWLLGVAHGAAGRYGTALEVLAPLSAAGAAPHASAETTLFAALAGCTAASVHRQLGRHARARAADNEALALCGGPGLRDGQGEPPAEAVFDARLGLAADAVGLGELPEAVQQLDLASALVTAERAEQWWRQQVRLDWVRAEVALLAGDPSTAANSAIAAARRAEAAGAPRHLAKSLLFLGLAQLQLGSEDSVDSLQRAATLAEELDTVPLLWPARALLGALLADRDPGAGAQSLTTARAAVLRIAADLPDDLREQWLGRADIAALLQP